MLKIRLRRQGAKFQPHYRIVVADSRAPRDGRIVSNLGYYDPRTEPSTIHVDGAAIDEWVRKGAQPTDAVVRILKQANISPEVVAKFQSERAANGSASAPTSSAATAAAAAAETEAETES